ncbi:MAG: TonB-dependent receptor [Verrucomicrobiota bacterium]
MTGSNIRRVDAETALPVTVFDQEDIAIRGGSTGADLFATLTLAEPPAINEATIASQGARGDVTSIDLRGLGSGSTLMLINGRRVAPHPLSGTENGVPSLATNANIIPTALLDRVEILRDGASAIYGADAAAGVINSLVSRGFDGRRLSGRVALTQHGGAEEYRFTAMEGFTRGRTHISVSLDFFHREDLASKDRKWASQSDLRLTRTAPAPWNGRPVVDPVTGVAQTVDNDLHNGSTINPYGQFQRGFIQSDFQTFVGSRPDGNRGISTAAAPESGVATASANGTFFFYPTAAGGINWKQTTPLRDLTSQEQFYYGNVLSDRVLIPRTNRVNFAAFADHRLNENIAVFGDLLYSGSRSFSQREPANMQNVNEPGLYVPATNPYNPFGVRFYHPTGAPNADGTPRLVGAPADVTIISGLIPAGMKTRGIRVDSHFFRAMAGVRGSLARDWQWESAAMYSAAQSHEYETNIFRESRLRQALNRTDATAYNPFPVTFKLVNEQIVADRPFVNPDSVTEPMYDRDNRFGHTKLFTWDVKANGELWQLLGGGRMKVATGAELRWESYDAKKDVYAGLNPPGAGSEFPYMRDDDNDFIAMSPNVPIDAAQTIYATYAELALPFVTRANRLPLVEALELSLAGRFEHFSIFGQSTKPKASLVWNPFNALKLRGSYNESFRAPNLVQTNTTPLLRVGSSDDPYRSEVTGALADASRPRRTFRQGNGNLRPETAKSWVAGFVLDVPKVRGLSITFDYWRISQKDAISSLGVPETMLRDELFLDLATQKALAGGTPIDQVNLGSGTDAYQGYGQVARLPVTEQDRAAFAAYNARQPTAATRRAPVGELSSIINDYINLGGRELAGAEFGFQYRLRPLQAGQFTLKGEATHYLKRDEQLTPNGLIVSALGKDGRAEWRGNLTLTWQRGSWSAGWFANYFGEFASTAAATTKVIYDALGQPKDITVINDNGILRYYLRVEPLVTHNAYVAYRFTRTSRPWLRDLSVRFGVNNVFDTWPPLADTAEAFQVGTADPRGRQFSLEVSRRF